MEWWDEPTATTDAEVRRRHLQNRRSWEQAADAYAREVEATTAFLAAGGSNLHPVERDVLAATVGPLRRWCEVAVHLQCASGRDTLSLLNEGVRRVVGVDISATHVANARRTAAALGADARFLRADVLDVPHDLDGTADLVYTGRGALSWLHDLDRWAAVVARLVRPGGWLSVFDDHPTSSLFDPHGDPPAWNGSSYFGAAASGRGWPEEFLDEGSLPGHLEEWHGRYWTFAELVAALVGHGLAVFHLGEWAVDYATPHDELPDDRQAGPIPLTFSLLAQRER